MYLSIHFAVQANTNRLKTCSTHPKLEYEWYVSRKCKVSKLKSQITHNSINLKGTLKRFSIYIEIAVFQRTGFEVALKVIGIA